MPDTVTADEVMSDYLQIALACAIGAAGAYALGATNTVIDGARNVARRVFTAVPLAGGVTVTTGCVA